ncbi:lysine-specific demethylase hairless isoform X3 [Anser cygnoides]|uniref:lysine-specific demethylase hairless isoform X3 n=1 Tax=Anser cygnoides TaxID=8845 RepID=UPI0034D19FE7
MASEARMGEAAPRWRRAPEAAQDPRGLESSAVPGVLPRSAATDPALGGYQEPPKLSYSPGLAADKGCPWRGSEGCVEPAGLPLGCPYPPAPQRLRDALCLPKDSAELPLLLAPRNGQPKEPPRWAEAVLAPLALYSHAYHRYPLPFPAADTQRPGKPRGDGDPPAFRSCPFLVEAKHSPFLLSSLLPPGPPPEPGFGGGGPEGPVGDGRFAGTDWRLGPFVPAWGAQPLYLGVPLRCKAAPGAFGESCSSGSKEFYPKKEPGFHLQAEDQEQLPGGGQPGHGGDGEGDTGVPQPPGAPWRDGRAGDLPAAPPPHPHTPPLSTAPPLLLPQPSVAAGGVWVGARPHAPHLPQCKPKDKRPAYQSLEPSSPPAPGGTDPRVDRHYPTAPPCPPGGGCGALGPFDASGPDGDGPLGGDGGRFPCPPSIHTKLKKTWLTRHSEQSVPRCKGGRRDGPEGAGEGKRSAKRPHGAADGHRGAAEGAGAAKRGAKATERPGGTEHQGGTEHLGGTRSGGVPAERTELGEGGPPVCAGQAGPEPWCLQSVPCTALPKSIPRCCACAARAAGSPGDEDEDEELAESTCRLLRFRRLAFGDGGELSVDGFCTVDEAEGEAAGLEAAEGRGRSSGSSLCLAKYLLSVLGGPFCAAVRRDRGAWLGAHGQPGGLTAWRRGEGAPRLCDACQRRCFNSHWSCAACGFQLCPECHRGRQQEDGHGDPARPQRCAPGHDHDPAALVPTQFVPTRVLARLWQLLHEARAKFDVKWHCPCGVGDTEQGPAEPPGGRQEKMGSVAPPLVPSTNGETTARAIKEESPEGGPPGPPPPPPPRGAVQTATLCDLLASTAVKLCLGHNGVRMAFAPVAPPLPSDNRLTSILDSIIARVVERKIQERHAGCELSCPGPPGPPGTPGTPVSHCILAPGGLLWLQDPGHATNYRLFQEHWRQGQPVLVSGLEKRLDGRLWGPESFRPPGGEQEVEAVNLRAQQRRVRMGSGRFWDGFAASATCPVPEQGAGDVLKLESGFGDMQLCRATNLSSSLPLPEYCGPHGRLNLASYLRGERGRRWLRPRVCAAYGVHPQDGSVGTKNLTVEAADTISVLVHAAARHGREPLLHAEEDGMDELLQERLRGAGSRPGALWHIFRAEDAGRIQDFLRKVDQRRGGVAEDPPGLYLDPELRRRLREECGVSAWTLLQCLGDAVLVPAGAPHQVQNLTSTIAVEQRFLSPESAARLGDHGTGPPGAARWLRAQLDGMILAAVREAVGVLQGCR